MTISNDDLIVASTSWADLPHFAGQTFQSGWLKVERERLSWFDQATYIDENSNQLDGTLYPEGLVEGFHLLALLDHLVNQVCYVDDRHWSGWNYGFDSVRFTSMVTSNDPIRVRGVVKSVEPRNGRFLVLLECTLEVQGREKPGLVAEWKVLWTRATEENQQ